MTCYDEYAGEYDSWFLANGIYLLSLWLRIERKNARQTV